MDIIKRGKTWHFRWSLPQRYRSIAGKNEIHMSLKTDSESEATRKAAELKRTLKAQYEAVLSGKVGSPPQSYADTVKRAADLGVEYQTAAQLAKGDIKVLLQRVTLAEKLSPDATNGLVVAALLGGAVLPDIRVSALAEHVEEIANAENSFKNDDQMRIWRNGRKRVVAQMLEAAGDMQVKDFDAFHAQLHVRLLEEKIAKNQITATTAKKELSIAAGMLRHFYKDAKVLKPPKPYEGQHVSKGIAKLNRKSPNDQRKREIPAELITGALLAPGALDGLNAEARDILLICVETGCRQSEIFNTPLDDIHLDHKYPHFYLQPILGIRELKNDASERHVPLVGVALSAMRRVVKRGGFKKYAGKSAWSPLVNKYIRENKILPEGYTIGGLRHSWEGRMRRAGVHTDDRGVMMGHSVANIRGREEYGDYLLQERYEIAQSLAFAIEDPVAHLGDSQRYSRKSGKSLPCQNSDA